jgi:hypothetical protein
LPALPQPAAQHTRRQGPDQQDEKG